MWTTSLPELRTLLHDGPQDKRAHEKRVIGPADGKNLIFKTVEQRYVPTTLKIFVNGVLKTIATDYTESDPVAGEFTFVTNFQPSQDSPVKASYYYQYFLDAELTTFILDAARKLGFTDATQIDDGLIPACKHYAASDAWEKQAVRWTELLSQQYLSEDSIKGDNPMPKANMFSQLAASMMKIAVELRDDFYKEQGRRLTPGYSVLVGDTRETQPMR